MTAGNNLIGSNVFMIDCYQIVIGEAARLVGACRNLDSAQPSHSYALERLF